MRALKSGGGAVRGWTEADMDSLLRKLEESRYMADGAAVEFSRGEVAALAVLREIKTAEAIGAEGFRSVVAGLELGAGL